MFSWGYILSSRPNYIMRPCLKAKFYIITINLLLWSFLCQDLGTCSNWKEMFQILKSCMSNCKVRIWSCVRDFCVHEGKCRWQRCEVWHREALAGNRKQPRHDEFWVSSAGSRRGLVLKIAAVRFVTYCLQSWETKKSQNNTEILAWQV